jgi:hypothetical protein
MTDTHILITLPTNDWKKDRFLSLNRNGTLHSLLLFSLQPTSNPKMPNPRPPRQHQFPTLSAVVETSAIMLYLLKEYDSERRFGFQGWVREDSVFTVVVFLAWECDVRQLRLPSPSILFLEIVKYERCRNGCWRRVKQDQPTEGQLSPFWQLADQKDQFEVPYLPISDFGRGEWAEIARCSWLLQERNLAGLRCARNPPVW